MNGIGDWPVFDADVAWDDAQEALTTAELSDGFTVETVQEFLQEHSKVHVSRISAENLESWNGQDRHAVGEHYYPAGSPSDIQIAVAGGAGKHSAFIPAFGNTAASSMSINKT